MELSLRWLLPVLYRPDSNCRSHSGPSPISVSLGPLFPAHSKNTEAINQNHYDFCKPVCARC